MELLGRASVGAALVTLTLSGCVRNENGQAASEGSTPATAAESPTSASNTSTTIADTTTSSTSTTPVSTTTTTSTTIPATPVSTSPPAPIDWSNHSYPLDCSDTGTGSLTLIDGHQAPGPNNSLAVAELASAVEVTGGNTVVLIDCLGSSPIEGKNALLVAADGTVLSAQRLPFEQIDGMTFAEPSWEGWESGVHDGDAASIIPVTLRVDGNALVTDRGVAEPRCAGLKYGESGEDFNGRALNHRGELVRRVQQRLIDLGYGSAVQASGGADGWFGSGTIEALTAWMFDTYEIRWPDTSNLPGDLFADEGTLIWVDVGWMDALGIECHGEYTPSIPNQD